MIAVALIAISCMAAPARAADSYFELNGFAFSISEQGEATIHAYDGDSDAVVIPRTLLRAPVVCIDDYAFYGKDGSRGKVLCRIYG